jgi:methoxymalonate biosynthesis acyl carrier protein
VASIDTTDTTERAARLTEFLARHVRKESLDPDEDIFAAGYVNSLFALQLIAFIEKTFAISVEDDDLELTNFATVSAIERFIERKRGGAAPP